MLPTRAEAEKLLGEAEERRPGPWANHCRVAAHCAECIASACEGLDEDKAYVLALLHDIGRGVGPRQLGHVVDGYSYMMSLGYDEVAQVCLTHSFEGHTTNGYVGEFDTTAEELALINAELAQATITDYDRLVQLCDSLAGTEGVMDIEERMADVRRRYGNYPPAKWENNLQLKAYFETWAHADIYDLVEKGTFRLGDVRLRDGLSD